jgi:two-component system, NtrC family, response regulator AtoC
VDDHTFVDRAGAELTEEIRSSRLCLIGIIGGTAVTYELPPHGTVIIGRARDADIRIDHASISRRHAALHIIGSGQPAQLEDLGSSNGTRLREQPIAAGSRVELRPGETMRVGSITLVLQTRLATPQIRAFWTHGYFEGRVAEECARAQATGSEFAVLRVRLDPGASGAAQEAFGAVLASIDVAGIYAPGEYEALLIPVPDRDPREVAARVVEVLAEANVKASAGVAAYPSDGRNAYVLLSKASAIARGEGGASSIARTFDTNDIPSAAMRDVYALCAQVAKGEINVLVLGETGVGKEVMAERIHRQSPRTAKPLLKLNCAALSEPLLESELFGHERGAFTGADRQKLGLLETAQGGTVFLDEIGELPLGLQAKLLRVIDDHKLLRVGGLKPISIDVRFVAATNRDLESEVTNGRFRQDLYYRLNGVSLHIPPLRERREEIPALVRHFAAAASRTQDHPPPVSAEALELLEHYAWPGNIRELRNVVERAILLCGDGPIEPDHLPIEKMRATVTSTSSSLRRKTVSVPPHAYALDKTPLPERTPTGTAAASLRDELSAIERGRIEEALRACGGNQSAAAKLLGIPRPTFLKRLDAYGIARPRKR